VLFEPLSNQELRVLRLLAAGHSNQEIAHELIVSVNTVKAHVKHIYDKLGVNNRRHASEAAHQLNLITGR
jgi:LuxR family maltose regulon positive regulatory protein